MYFLLHNYWLCFLELFFTCKMIYQSHFKLFGFYLKTCIYLDCHCTEKFWLLGQGGQAGTIAEDSATGSNESQTVWPHIRKYQVLGEPHRGGNKQKHPNMG